MPHCPKPPSQTWRTFLQNHLADLVSVDFFVVPTVTFRVLYVFVKAQSSQWSEGQPEGPAVVTVHPDVGHVLPDRALARLESAIGSMTVRIRHDARQRRDVALLSKGGHLRDGRCANLLTRARATDLGGGGALYDEAVRLAGT